MSTPLRIVFFLHSNLRHGANLVMLRHAAYLRAQAQEVHVVFKTRDFGKALDYAPAAVPLSCWYLDEWQRAATGQADIAITNWWQCAYDFSAIPAALYSYYLHGDHRASYHNAPYHIRLFDPFLDQMERADLRWYCVSEALAAPLRALGHTPMVLPPGVDFDCFANATPALPHRIERLRVLVEGPLDADFKRVADTIALLRDINGIEIVHMAADGSRAPGAHHALGALSHAATAGVFAACDLIVRLSAQETFAMPVLEQFAAGGSAVVTRFPGHDQYIQDGVNARVVDLADPFPAARAALLEWLADPAPLARLRVAARATARAYDWSIICARFADDLLAAPRHPAGHKLPLVEAHRDAAQAVFERWAKLREATL